MVKGIFLVLSIALLVVTLFHLFSFQLVLASQPIVVINGSFQVDVGKDATIIVGPEPEVIIKECEDGEERCEETYYYICEENGWVGKGQVSGKCGYTEETGEGGGGGWGGVSMGAGNGEEVGEGENGYCVELWDCDNWSVCEDGKQIRTCTDLNNCGTDISRPSEEKECAMFLKSNSNEYERGPDVLGAVTGLVGKLGESKFIIAGLFVAVVIIASLILALRRRPEILEKPKGKRGEQTGTRTRKARK